jgi:hypothetical protein
MNPSNGKGTLKKRGSLNLCVCVCVCTPVLGGYHIFLYSLALVFTKQITKGFNSHFLILFLKLIHKVMVSIFLF